MKRRVREEEEVGELNIVPYLDIVTNLLMFMLLSTVGVISLGVLDVGTPRIGEPDSASLSDEPQQPQEPQLNLTVAISKSGFFLAGSGGVLGDAGDAGGINTQREPTVPKKGNDYDYEGLTKRLAEIKVGFPKEQRIILVADMDIPYDIVISTMDASREKIVQRDGNAEKAVLFPEVWLSMMQ